MTNQIAKNNYRSLLLGICLTALTVILICFNWYWLRANYINLTRNHFKTGQKVFVIPQLFDANSKFSNIGVLRMIRPVNELDIDLMNISDSQKASLKKKLDPSLKPYLIFNHMWFGATELKAAKTSFIGNFITHEILNTMGEKGNLIKYSFCQISPRSDLLYDNSQSFKMPYNYTWANSKYYLLTESITDEELPSFVR